MMLEIIKSTPATLAAAGQLPARAFAALRYMFTPFPDIQAPSAPAAQADAYALSFRHISFTFAVISLAAQVARADGKVTRAEYLAFRDYFPLTGGICGKIRQLFALACESPTPFTHHTQQIKNLFPGKKDLVVSLVDKLFGIATADAPLSTTEERLLAKISRALDMSAADYSALYDKHSRPLAAHHVLGVKKREKRSTLKKRYHALMQRYHPDRFAAETTSPEVQLLLTLKTSEIAQAYSLLTKKKAA